jgi:plasmid stabilization system protein ParE
MSVRFTRRALVQLDEILETIAVDEPRAAAGFAHRIEALTALLERHPEMGRTTDLGSVRVFSTRPYPYLLFYRAASSSGDGIIVLRIRHMARKEDWHRGR